MLIQTEQQLKLNLELQSATQKRRSLEELARQAWSTSTLSPDAVEAKLAEVRTTRQTDTILKIIHDAYNDDKLKQDAIDMISNELDEKTSKLKEHDAELEKLKALKNKKNVEVSLLARGYFPMDISTLIVMLVSFAKVFSVRTTHAGQMNERFIEILLDIGFWSSSLSA